MILLLIRIFGLIFLVGCADQGLEQSLIFDDSCECLLGIGLSIHIRQHVGQLRPGLQEFSQRLHLPGYSRRREVIHTLKVDIDRQVTIAPQRLPLLVTPIGGISADQGEDKVVVENDFF